MLGATAGNYSPSGGGFSGGQNEYYDGDMPNGGINGEVPHNIPINFSGSGYGGGYYESYNNYNNSKILFNYITGGDARRNRWWWNANWKNIY